MHTKTAATAHNIFIICFLDFFLITARIITNKKFFCKLDFLFLTPTKIHKNRRTCRRFLCIGRSNRIRTYDLYVPNVALYQTELYSDFTNNKQNFLMKALAIIEHPFSFATLFCNTVKKIQKTLYFFLFFYINIAKFILTLIFKSKRRFVCSQPDF